MKPIYLFMIALAISGVIVLSYVLITNNQEKSILDKYILDKDGNYKDYKDLLFERDYYEMNMIKLCNLSELYYKKLYPNEYSDLYPCEQWLLGGMEN